MSPGPHKRHALLEFIDALITKTARPAGLDACVCLGVEGAAGASEWLQVDLRPTKMAAQSVAGPPHDATAVLLLGDDAATSLLSQGRLPTGDSSVRFRGDAAVMRRFIDRITTRTSLLDLRATKSPRKPPVGRPHRRL